RPRLRDGRGEGAARRGLRPGPRRAARALLRRLPPARRARPRRARRARRVDAVLGARSMVRGAVEPARRLPRGRARPGRPSRRAERGLLGGRDGPRVIAVSQGLAARIAAVYPGAKPRTTVVPNGVDSDRFDPESFRAGRAATRRALGVPEDAYVGLHLAHAPW